MVHTPALFVSILPFFSFALYFILRRFELVARGTFSPLVYFFLYEPNHLFVISESDLGEMGTVTQPYSSLHHVYYHYSSNRINRSSCVQCS